MSTTTEVGVRVRAAVLASAPGDLAVEELVLDPVLEPHEVRVRVRACGLCHSDLHMLDGTLPTALPTVPGHEIAGVVEAVGSAVDDLVVGATVVACLSMYCGRCAECRTGRSWLCVRRNDLGRAERPRPRLSRPDGAEVGQVAGLGGLVERTVLHRNSVVEVPADLPPDRAALLGCAVVTGVGSVQRGARVRPGETVVVVGVGGVGLNVVQGARLAGARRIVAVDVRPAKLELARTFGATDVVDAGAGDAVAAVRDLLGDVDHVFDVVGRSATVAQAVQMLRPGRTAWLVGIPPVGEELRLPGLHLLTQAKGVQGLLMGSNRFTEDIPVLAELYRQGRLELDALVSARLPLERAGEGFELMREGGAARAVVCLD
ncbi:zinc-binding dehydrogenase [Nocardioides sp. YIM 152315]|uniref:zinc-binding dehydrogenase n=1 Tax=Nocardioides sp. YIM 152315 TaxID=3031760 RepID=UPI0023DA0D65|nr:zinc-binding dehydrogenase [Nocardioides sp. YIM 152315]MDF1604708.1 alcohol dehydrogenase catalytic domain-containing protein [Nocardioides sp. YIM 152315]